MKVKCEIDLDLDEKEWKIRFKNESNPGEPMDMDEVFYFLKETIYQIDRTLNNADEDDPQITKMIN